MSRGSSQFCIVSAYGYTLRKVLSCFMFSKYISWLDSRETQNSKTSPDSIDKQQAGLFPQNVFAVNMI